MRSLVAAAGLALTATVAVALWVGAGPAPSGRRSDRVEAGIHKIRHVVVVVQENRSFDSYFGTYPGADGIPMQGGVPTVCVPDPASGACVKPFHDRGTFNGGGPHTWRNSIIDVNGGKMDGFLATVEASGTF